MQLLLCTGALVGSHVSARPTQHALMQQQQDLKNLVTIAVVYPQLPVVLVAGETAQFIAEITVAPQTYNWYSMRALDISVEVDTPTNDQELEKIDDIGRLKLTRPGTMRYLFAWQPTLAADKNGDGDGDGEVKCALVFKSVKWWGWYSETLHVAYNITVVAPPPPVFAAR